MKNSLLKLICMLLCLALSLGAFAGCNGTKNGDTSSDAAQVDTESSGDGDNDATDGEEEEPTDGWDNTDLTGDDSYGSDDDDSYGDGDTDGSDPWSEPVNQFNVYNSEAPINTNYMGMSGDVWHTYSHMQDESTGRVYTDEQIEKELTISKEMGVRYTRTFFTTRFVWNSEQGNWDLNSNRFGWFIDYCKNVQKYLDGEGKIILGFGMGHDGMVYGGEGGTVLTQTPYIYGHGADLNGEYNTYKDCIATEYMEKSNKSAWDMYKNRRNVTEDSMAKGAGQYLSTGDTAADKAVTVTENYERMGKAAIRLAAVYVDMLLEAKARGVNNIEYLLYYTEPSVSYNLPDEWQMGYYANEYLFTCMTMKNVLKKAGIAKNYKHMGPNQYHPNGQGLLKYVAEREPALFDAMSAHLYITGESNSDSNIGYTSFETFSDWSKTMEEYGLLGKSEFWIDEQMAGSGTDDPISAGWKTKDAWVGLQTALQGIICQQVGIDNYVVWQWHDMIFTDLGPSGGQFNNGIHDTGIKPSYFISSIPGEAMYTLGLFTRYNGHKNGTIYRTTNFDDCFRVYMGAVKLEDGSWTVTVVNTDVMEAEIRIDFDKAINQTLYRHTQSVGDIKATSQCKLAQVDKVYKDVGKTIVDTVPGGSVTVYTGCRF